jgi:Cytochrome c554 and c-prime
MTTRIGARPWADIALFTAILAFGGCSSSPTDSSVPEPGRSGRAGGTNPRSGRLLADMGQPDMALIVSGQLDGYLEPCGCTKGQAGGLIRRYQFIECLRQQNWPIALIDLGGLIGDPAGARGGMEQARIKFQYILKALGLLKYDALSASVDDLRVGVKQAMAMYRDDLGETTKVVIANVKTAGAFETRILPSVLVTVGQVRLGVTSAVDPALLAKLVDPDKEKLLPAIMPPNQALPRILAELESQSDYQVLMVQGTYEVAARLAEANPGFEIVVANSDSVEPRTRRPEILNGGNTTLVSIGRRGHHVGVFAFYRDRPTRRPTYHLVSLNDLYNGPGTAMKTLIQDDYRAALKAARVVETFPKGTGGGPTGAVYVGAKTCATCHANTYKKWSTTKHSQAFVSLLHDPKPNTAFDAECVTCHTTGFPYMSGWRSETATPYLAGNQCENCHGPGSKHAADPENTAFRQSMTAATDEVRKTLCFQCHDHDNSPDFDFTRFWPQIAHKGLDDYVDPKVHRGLTARPVDRSSSASQQ